MTLRFIITVCSISLLMNLLSSCKENLVIPNPPVSNDTIDIYNWQDIRLNGLLGSPFAFDTSNVFIPNGYRLLFYNGDTIVNFEMQEPGYFVYGINGIDKYNIFLAGGNSYNGQPILKKIQSGTIINYPLNDDSGRSFFDILCMGSNEVWLSTIRSNNLYHFQSGQFVKYAIDDSVFGSRFFLDKNHMLYSYGLKSLYGETFFALYIYRFANNTYNLIRIDSLNSQPKTNYIYRCGNELTMLGFSNYCVLRFNGYDWENYLTDPPETFSLTKIGGLSKDYLLLFDDNNWKMFIWNGEWHKEKKFNIIDYSFFPDNGTEMSLFNSNVYISVSSANLNYSHFIIGRKK